MSSRTSQTPRPRPPRPGGGLPAQRSGQDRSPGWWQTPKRRGPAAEDAPKRHRAADVTAATRVMPVTTGDPAPVPPPASRGTGGRRRRPPVRPTPEQAAATRRRRIRRALLGSAVAVVLSPLLAFAVGYLFFAVPDPDAAVNNQVTLVTFADGSQAARLVEEQGNRIKVPVGEVPVPVRDAVLAAEDRSFYSNPGFDITGIARAAWSQLRGGTGGGSTITQQLVKKTLVGDEATLWRKYKEVVLAVKISQERTKDEILGSYLNAIYFGRGAYGIQAASQAYFGKPVGELDVAEGAMLAGLIQSPSRWDPAVNPERAVQRWNFVLDGMVGEGWLSAAERDAALFPPTAPRKRAAGGVPADSRGHIVNAVTAELADLGISEQDIAQKGLRISTTIDPVRQAQAVAAAQEKLAGQPLNLRSAMVAVEPGTGAIRAYYGGSNGLGLDYARVRRLAGSTFKPFVVLAGLQQQPPVGLGEVFDGEEIPGLRNAEGADCDRCDLKQAMTVSNNVVFNTLARKVGAENVAAAARAAGITAPLDDPNAGIALGNKEVSALELASAYATIAAGGVWHQPHLVSKVVTNDDRVLYEASAEGERRFPEQVARNVTETMLDVARRDGLGLPGGRPVAAKTGTVESRFDGDNNDAWMAGFTPSLSTSVWIGTDMNSPIRTARGVPISGKTVPGDVWQEFMRDALEAQPVERFPAFQPIGEAPSQLPPGEAEPPPAPPVPPEPAVDPVTGQPLGPDGQPVPPEGTPGEGLDGAAPDDPALDGAAPDDPGSVGADGPERGDAVEDPPDCSIIACG
ncbi:MAG: transglycosylase domain-containing protein [Pseudonocardia sp.]